MDCQQNGILFPVFTLEYPFNVAPDRDKEAVKITNMRLNLKKSKPLGSMDVMFSPNLSKKMEYNVLL